MYSDGVHNLLQKIGSTSKKKEKIESLQNLAALLDRTEAHDEITQNSIDGSRDKETWKNIYLQCHQNLIQDSQKNSTKITKTDEDLISSYKLLIEKIIRYSSSSEKIIINFNYILHTTCETLSLQQCIIYYDTYLTILSNYFLSNRLYRELMESENWEDIFELCLKIFKNRNAKEVLICNTLKLIVKYGCSQSNLIHNINSILPILLKGFDEGNLHTRESLELTYIICKNIGIEFHKTLIHFSEQLIPKLLRNEIEKSSEKHKLLLLFVIIHHPNGVISDESTFNAHNVEEWRTLMLQMYRQIMSDIKLSVNCPNFTALAVEVLVQLIKDPVYRVERLITSSSNESTQENKRRRLNIIKSPLDIFNDDKYNINDIDSQIPFFHVLSHMIEKYPSIIENELTFLIKMVKELFSIAIKNEKMIKCLCKLSKILIKTEIILNLNISNDIKICWKKISYEVIKILSLKQNEIEGHELLQLLMDYIDVLEINKLLSLYKYNEIVWSPSSIVTLNKFLQSIKVQNHIDKSLDEEQSTRVELIKWILGIPPYVIGTSDTVVHLCEILTNLSLQIWYKQNFSQNLSLKNINDNSDIFDTNEFQCLNNMTKYHLLLAFQLDFFNDDNNPDVKLNDKKNQFIKPPIIENIINYIIELIKNFITQDTHEIFKSIFLTSVISKFLSNLFDLNFTKTDNHCSNLLNILENSIEKIYNLLSVEDDILDLNNTYLLNIIKAFVALYETNYHCDIRHIIVNTLPSNVMLKFLQMIIVPDKNKSPQFENLGIKFYENIFELKDLCKIKMRIHRHSESSNIHDSDAINVGIHKVIISFCCISNADGKISHLQSNILKNILQIDLYPSTVIANIWQSLVSLKQLAKCDKNFYNDKSMEIIINFIEGLYSEWKNDNDAVDGLIQIISLFFDTAKIFDGEYVDKLIKILSKIHYSLLNNKFGLKVYHSFFKCLNILMKNHPFLKLYDSEIVNKKLTIIEIALEYLNTSFFTVRLKVIKIIYNIFLSNDIEIGIKKKCYKFIEKNSLELFTVNRKLTEYETHDEWNTRVTTIIYLFCSIIKANALFHSKSLKFLLLLHYKNEIPIQVIVKSLQSILNNNKDDYVKLIQIHLYYLINESTNSSLDNFPWEITLSSNAEQYYNNYLNIIIFNIFDRKKFSSLMTLCEHYKFSYSDVIENNLSSIIIWLFMQSTNTDDNSCQEYAKNIINQFKNSTDEFKNIKKMSTLINKKLDDILIDIMKKLHDQEHYSNIFHNNIYFPDYNLPNYPSDIIEHFLELLQLHLNVNTSLMQYLLKNKPNVIQNVLLNLSHNISEFKIIEYKVKAFHQYIYFCNLLINDINNKSANNIAMFIVKDISYTIIHMIKLEENVLSELAAEYLLYFLKKIVSSRSEEISVILSFLVNSLITIILKKKVDKYGLKILNFLLIESRELLQENIIPLINLFPKDKIFNDIRRHYASSSSTSSSSSSSSSSSLNNADDDNFKSIIEHFLDTDYENYNYDGLLHLKMTLLKNKKQLNEMYEELKELRGFAEDCHSSLLHRLIHKLIKFTQHSDTNISLEAARILGEIGPTDLKTLILYPEENYIKESLTHEEIFVDCIIIKLIEYLVCSNFKLQQASANALYEILSSYWGHKILSSKNNSNNDIDKELLLKYLNPFISKQTVNNNLIGLNEIKYKECFDIKNELWKGVDINSYSKWIINMVCTLINCFDNFYANNLIPVFKLDTKFCEIILPKLIYLIINVNNESIEDVSKCIDNFFTQYFISSNRLNSTSRTSIDASLPTSSLSSSISASNSTLLSTSTSLSSTKKPNNDHVLSYEAVKSMINVINFCRIQSNDNYLLKLNYLHIAKVAQYCSAYFTSVFYAELYCETFKNTYKLNNNNSSLIDYVCKINLIDGKCLQQVLQNAFSHIGDPDSIYGCGLYHLKDPSSRLQHHIHLNHWDNVMITEDVQTSLDYCDFKDYDHFCHALKNLGYNGLLNHFLKSNHDKNYLDEHMYETSWRLSDWGVVQSDKPHLINNINSVDLFQHVKKNDYYYNHYQALKCFKDNNMFKLKEYNNAARLSIIKSFRDISLECIQTIYSELCHLQLLSELEQFSTSNSDELFNIFELWNSQNLNNINNFSFIEPIISQRITMLKIKLLLNTDDKYNDENLTIINNTLADNYLKLSSIAENSGYYNIAKRSLISVSKLNNYSEDIKHKVVYHDAKLSWAHNENDIGRFILKDLLNEPNLNLVLKAKALRVYGNWAAETRSENPQAIVDHYFMESIKVNELSKDYQTNIDNLNYTYAALAHFADNQYKQITEFMKTAQYESLKESSSYAANAINIKPKDEEEKTALRSFHRQNENLYNEYKNYQNDQQSFLKLAVKYYLLLLKNSSKYDFSVFRLISLWFNNQDNKDIHELIEIHLNQISSYKFLTLIPQLAARLSNNTSNLFHKEIYNLLLRCSKKHPHHTLPTILALKNTHKDSEYSSSSSSKSQKVISERELGAKKLINDLNKIDCISKIIQEMDTTAHALIQLAYFKFNAQNSAHSIPRSLNIHKINNYKYSLLPTVTIPCISNGNYNNIVSIYKYENKFDSVGGINAPKKIYCIGTDGNRRVQLVKGQDDLRQDAVMQQVFNVMNLLLKCSKETERRKLNIRTYKIVPLSQRSGLLEWCQNTEPLINILNKLHTKYYPKDWKTNYCREKMKLANSFQNQKDKEKIYSECCKNVRPAFQHFFTEMYPSPQAWFERRLTYTRSIATNSMVGYILGLGDRHCSNILIDSITAEVVHIDFGIAFEAGKVLPTPETIPFRLTRDIEAAMGPSGSEGVMRKCCEATMTVLHNESETIITLLQVLLWDPLYIWAITPEKAWELQKDDNSYKRSSSSSENHNQEKCNKSAERVLLRVEQKLQGTEEGVVTTVAGQVERLIQQARDPANLCRIFYGWQPYL